MGNVYRAEPVLFLGLEFPATAAADARWRSRLAAPKEARKAMEGGDPEDRAG